MHLFYRFYFVFFLSILNGICLAEEETVVLSVEECICIALRDNPDIKVAELNAIRAIGEKNLARSFFLPQIDLEGVIDNSNRTLAGNLTQFQDFRSTRALGLSMQLGLFDFGSTWKHFKAMKLRIDVAEWEKKKVAADIEELVRVSYYRVLEKQHILDVLRHSEERLVAQLQKIKNLYEAGVVRCSDVLSVQVQLVEAEKNVLQAQHELELAWFQLNRLLNFPYCKRFVLQDITSPEIYTTDISAVCGFACAERPDLAAIRTELEALYNERSALSRKNLPAFYAFANTNVSFGDHASVSAGIGMSMPIYHGGARRAELQILDSQIGQVTILFEETRKNMELDIRKLCLRLEEIKQNHCLSVDSVAYAQQNFLDNEDLYQKGLASIHDLLLAQEQLEKAKLSSIMSIYDEQYAIARLVNISGGFCIN